MVKLPSKLKLPILFISLIAILLGLSYYLASQNTSGQAQNRQQVLAKKEAERIFKECDDGKGGETCYGKKLGEYTKKNPLESSLQVLSELADVDPNSRGCHLIAHYITLAETEKDPSKWEDILGKVDSSSCTGGFIHGVLEAKSRLDSNFVLNGQTVPEICDLVGDKHGKGGEFNCSHIMGHILMAENKGDIPLSIEICSQIPADLQFECFSGVFMENETRDNMVAHGTGKKIPWNNKTTQEQEKICFQYKGLAYEACFREIVHLYAFVSGNDPQETYKSCNKAGDRKVIDACYLHGVGVMTSSSRFDLGNMTYLCEPYDGMDDKFKTCMSWGINSLLTSSPKFIDRVARLCKEVPEGYKEACYQKAGDRLGLLKLTDEEKANLCLKIPENYRNLCLGG